MTDNIPAEEVKKLVEALDYLWEQIDTNNMPVGEYNAITDYGTQEYEYHCAGCDGEGFIRCYDDDIRGLKVEVKHTPECRYISARNALADFRAKHDGV